MLLTATVTALTLAGTPGLPLGDTSGKVVAPVARTYSADFTRLGVGGTATRPYGAFTKNPSPSAGKTYASTFTRLALRGTPTRVYGSFAGKSEAIEDTKYVSDTIRAYVNEGPVSEVEIAVLEVMTPRVTESRTVGVGRSVSDTLRPRVTEAIQFLDKGSSTAKAVSDTITPIVTEGSSFRVQIATSDTITPVVTDGAALEAVDVKAVSDTITVVLDETMLLQTALAARSFNVVDVVTPVITETAGNATAGEVDIISVVGRPYGIIRIVEI